MQHVSMKLEPEESKESLLYREI